MKPIDEVTPDELEERQRIYNRPESNHRKVTPIQYGNLDPKAWGEAYRRMVSAREKAKKREAGK